MTAKVRIFRAYERLPLLLLTCVSGLLLSACDANTNVSVAPLVLEQDESTPQTDWLSVERAMEVRNNPTLASAKAPPITDLIGRLEAKTVADPQNTGNWILLAQSHAFLGNTHASDAAAAQAIKHGADEHTVREQLQHAQAGGF